MDHSDAMRRIYERINTGDVPGFGDLLADDLVEHEAIPGVTPDKAGVSPSSECSSRRFPTCG
jgi:hypothetical protein